MWNIFLVVFYTPKKDVKYYLYKVYVWFIKVIKVNIFGFLSVLFSFLSALHMAAANGHLAVVEYLIQNGAVSIQMFRMFTRKYNEISRLKEVEHFSY